MSSDDENQSSDDGIELEYDRDEVLTGFTNLYKLIERLYLPDNSIRYPPSGGWPWPEGITFNPPKDDAVIDLMKHMPVFQRPDQWESLQIYEKTEAVDYSKFYDAGPHNINPDPQLTTLPDRLLMVGYPRGRNGHYIFLDTNSGTFTVCDFQVGPTQPTYLSDSVEDLENPVTFTDEYGEECTEHWVEYPTYTTAEFFDWLTKQFLELDLLPRPAMGEVSFADGPRDEESDQNKLRAVFEECGWPGEDYRKEECLKRVEELEKSFYE